MFRRLPIAILLAGALASWALGRGRDAPGEAPRPPPRPMVDVVEVAPRDVRIRLATHGTVEPQTQLVLAAEIAGRVQHISPKLEIGGDFRAGELLVELDPRDSQIALERVEANLARAQSEAQLALVKLERLRALSTREVVSPAALDEAKNVELVGAARVREAQAAVSRARRDLERTRVLAPFTGRVRSKQVETGEWIAPGAPLAKIYASDSFEVRLPILASELRYLDLPSENTAGSKLRLRSEIFSPGTQWSGTIVRSEDLIDPSTQMLHVIARVAPGPAPEPRLTVGLFVEAEIIGRHFEDVVVLPRSALVDGSTVMVVDSQDRLRTRRVEVLREDGDYALLRSGLANEERVVVSSTNSLDGEQVEIRTVSAAQLAQLVGAFE